MIVLFTAILQEESMKKEERLKRPMYKWILPPRICVFVPHSLRGSRWIPLTEVAIKISPHNKVLSFTLDLGRELAFNGGMAKVSEAVKATAEEALGCRIQMSHAGPRDGDVVVVSLLMKKMPNLESLLGARNLVLAALHVDPTIFAGLDCVQQNGWF